MFVVRIYVEFDDFVFGCGDFLCFQIYSYVCVCVFFGVCYQNVDLFLGQDNWQDVVFEVVVKEDVCERG